MLRLDEISPIKFSYCKFAQSRQFTGENVAAIELNEKENRKKMKGKYQFYKITIHTKKKHIHTYTYLINERN